jgi:Ser/Thr protein kinase RdoA (MazF antagonist)
VIPETPADLTPAFLSEALGTDVASIRIEDRAAGGIAVTSHVFRVICDAADGPDSVVVKIANPDYASGPNHYRREVRFYRDLASEIDLAIPRCFHAAMNEDATRFVLVLEDLTGRAEHMLDGCDLPASRALVRALANLHAAWWESPRVAAMEGWTKRYMRGRIEEITERCRGAWPKFLDAGAYPVPEGIAGAAEAALDRVPDALERMNRSPKTLIHFDPHVENVLFEGAEPIIIDWQCACFGHPVMDLVYAVGGNTREDVLAGHGGELLDEYHAALAGHGVKADLRDDHRAAMDWHFAGQVWFLAKFTPETEHDRRTLTREWERVAAALLHFRA